MATTHGAFIRHAVGSSKAAQQRQEEDSDEEVSMDWDAVDVLRGSATPSERSIDPVFPSDDAQTAATTPDPADSSSRITAHNRQIKRALHEAHAISLFAAFVHRNQLINNPLLHARLLSLVPLDLQDAFRNKVGDRALNFDKAVRDLMLWWHRKFELDATIDRLRLHSMIEVQNELERFTLSKVDDVYACLVKHSALAGEAEEEGKAKKSKKRKADALDPSPFHPELIRDAKSLHKRCLSMLGSPDMSVLLFTSLCRALSIHTRLVASLQPSPLNAVAKPKAPSVASSTAVSTSVAKKPRTNAIAKAPAQPKKRSKVLSNRMADNIDDPVDVKIAIDPISVETSKGSATTPISIDLDPDPAPSVFEPSTKRPKEEPPVTWVEVYSPFEGRWVSVDCVRKRMRCEKIMAPLAGDTQNRMVYVVAFERDGQAKDVTMRYAEDYFGRGWRDRLSAIPGQLDWFATAISSTRKRPYTLACDAKEDDELAKLKDERLAVFPTAISDFKDHPKYVLERFLRRDETIYPRSPVGLLWTKTESVYLRSSIVSLRTALDWQRQGRRILVDEAAQPLKSVLPRGGRGAEEALFALHQTEQMKNKAVKEDGTVPCDANRQVQVYQEHMMPRGGIHLVFKGAAELATNMEVSYAEAITGIQVKKGKVTPIICGIIVAERFAAKLQEAHIKISAKAEAKAKEKRILDRWTQLLRAAEVQQRMVAQPAEAVLSEDEVEEL